MSEAPKIRDFDKVVREQRLAVICGEQVDVTKIPSRVTLEMTKLADDADAMKQEESFYTIIDLVAKACKPSNEKITADWLLDNTDFETLMDFCEFVMEPIRERAARQAGGASGKA
jgi:hypothetical protein